MTAARIVLPALICLGMAGCASGDFGRTRDEAKNNDMHAWMGPEATGSVGRRYSDFQLTDKERQLRDLAYPLVEPPHSRPAWKSVFGDYTPLPAPWRQNVVFDRTSYGRLLIDEPHRSHASRYSQLIDDVRSDLTRFDPFYSAAWGVLDLDQRRNASLRLIQDVSPRERDDAIARMRENTLIVQWVGECLKRRVASYRWALERLVLQAPDGLASTADLLINELAARAQNPPVAGQPIGRAPVSSGGDFGREPVSKG
jgi:hypothetical protein